MPLTHVHYLRVRYSETDQMGTYYNSRALEWFERGRTELCRTTGVPYRQWEERGVMLPLIEAHVDFLGTAVYDDLLKMTTTLSMPSKARMRFDVVIEQAGTGGPVCRGWTVHAVTDTSGRPIRPPRWALALIGE
jgi:acyl-CoA thioester hydrolase